MYVGQKTAMGKKAKTNGKVNQEEEEGQKDEGDDEEVRQEVEIDPFASK